MRYYFCLAVYYDFEIVLVLNRGLLQMINYLFVRVLFLACVFVGLRFFPLFPLLLLPCSSLPLPTRVLLLMLTSLLFQLSYKRRSIFSIIASWICRGFLFFFLFFSSLNLLCFTACCGRFVWLVFSASFKG